MKVEQIYKIVNDNTKAILGESGVVLEDFSNIVQIGNAIFDANAVDNYVKGIINRIGKTVFVERAYRGQAPRVLMDAWEYGSILSKIRVAKLPEAEENEEWSLQDRAVYEQDMFYKIDVEEKFYNGRTTYQIPISIAEKQVKESFKSVDELNRFFSMIQTVIYNSLRVKEESLVMGTINHFTAMTIKAEVGSGNLYGRTGVKAVNVLYEYEQATGDTTLTPATMLKSEAFIKFLSYKIKLISSRMGRMSSLFNINGKENFTDEDRLHIVLLNEVATASDVYLQSDTFHNELTKLPNGVDTVTYWEGSGTDFSFASTSKVHIKTAKNDEVEVPYVLGVMFDRDSLGVSNLEAEVRSHYNAKAGFTNYWYCQTAGYFNDENENFVVLYASKNS